MTIFLFRYSPSTGTFTSSIAGLYYFSVYFEIDGNNHITVYIAKNGKQQCRARAEGERGDDGHEAAGSCSAVIELQPGDEVNVIVPSTSHSEPFETATINGFTGFLIQPYS